MKPKNTFTRLVAGLLTLALVFSAQSVSAKSSQELREELQALEAQAEENEAELERLEQQLSENFGRMEALVANKDTVDRQITLIHEQLANLEQRIRATGQLVADRQDALDRALAEQEELKRRHKERIRAMEEQGKLTYWSVLFKAGSFADLLDRIHMVREIAEADQRRLEELEAAAQAVRLAREALEDQKQALEESRLELENTRGLLQEKRAQADEVLRRLVQEEAAFQLLLEQSEDRQAALMEQLAQKEAELDEAEYREWLESYVPPQVDIPAPEAPESDADWITPVPWYILTSPFGMRLHPILGYYRMHNGVDLACDAGTPIYASRGGRVITAAYQADGAGNYVQLDHGDGYRSVYMHMTNYIVREGDYVAPGQIIGYVGNTGLSKGNHLHFGISYNGTYVNPMEYIG